jgi:hypothetical protein
MAVRYTFKLVKRLNFDGLAPRRCASGDRGTLKPPTACSAYARTEGINPADIIADLRSVPQLQRSHRKTAGSTAAREIVFSPSYWRNVSRC